MINAAADTPWVETVPADKLAAGSVIDLFVLTSSVLSSHSLCTPVISVLDVANADAVIPSSDNKVLVTTAANGLPDKVTLDLKTLMDLTQVKIKASIPGNADVFSQEFATKVTCKTLVLNPDLMIARTGINKVIKVIPANPASGTTADFYNKFAPATPYSDITICPIDV